MKNFNRFVLLAGTAICAALNLAPSACATDFSLFTREPGPGHRLRSYWWHFNRAAWELTPPEGFTLSGGGELRLWKADVPGSAVACRPATAQQVALLSSEDEKAQADYVRSLLPEGATNVRLAGQGKNPLPVNGLSNFLVSFTYDFAGGSFCYTLMVSQGGEVNEQTPPVPGQPTPAPTPTPAPSADGKPVRTGEFFTTIIATDQAGYGEILGAFEQMMAGAKVMARQPDNDVTSEYSSHGMLGR